MASQPSHNYNYSFLPEQSQEDALHATRLLHVEERPFQRVSQRLLSKDSLLKSHPRQLPSPPPEDNTTAPNPEEEAAKHEKFHQDILLDFAALESSILRLQLLLASNARERERYASEKAKIQATAHAVRENTFVLRQQLTEAQNVLELRKGYDNLAKELITKKELKARGETREEITRLGKEIEDLEAESQDIDGLWVGRKEAFDRVVREGQGLVKVIKGIKDEPEGEKDEVMDDREGGRSKREESRVGTPRPDRSTPLPGESTPVPGGSTPLYNNDGGGSPERAANRFLDVEDSRTQASSQVGSPLRRAEGEEGDVEMGEEVPQLEEVEAVADEAVKESTNMGTVEEAVDVPEEDPIATPAENMDES